MRIFITAVLAIGCLVGIAVPGAQADVWEISKDWALYGNLNQNHIPGIGGVACGPAAAINSFVYLENAYPWIYTNSLTPVQGIDYRPPVGVDPYDDMIAAAVVLGGANYMNTTLANGTWHDDFIWGKYSYIEWFVPGKTRYEAQDYWDWTNYDRPTWVDPVIPTWNFIYDELFDCEDVEILLSGDDFGHYLTLTSFLWDDAANSGMMDYIDPWTGAWAACNIRLQSGQIQTDYRGTGTYNSWISMAVSESPIPEPSTLLLLLGSGLIGVVYLRKRRVG